MTVPGRNARPKIGDGIEFADEGSTGDSELDNESSLIDLSDFLQEGENAEPTELDEDEGDEGGIEDDDSSGFEFANDDDVDDDDEDVDEDEDDEDEDLEDEMWESDDDSSDRDDEDEESDDEDADTASSSAIPASQQSMKPLKKNKAETSSSSPEKSTSKSSARSSTSSSAVGAASGLLSAVLSFLVNLGMKILGFTTKFLKKATKLPLIGKYIAQMEKNAALFNAVSVFLPVLLGGSLLGGVHAVTLPDMVKGYEFPDGGHITMEQVEADKDKNVVTAVAYNDGDIIAHDVIPSAKVYSTRLINPVSWISPRKATTCEAEMLDTLDIGQKKKVTMKCDPEHEIRGAGVKPQGFFVDANEVESNEK